MNRLTHSVVASAPLGRADGYALTAMPSRIATRAEGRTDPGLRRPGRVRRPVRLLGERQPALRLLKQALALATCATAALALAKAPARAQGYAFSPVYTFTGGGDGGNPSALAVDADGNAFILEFGPAANRYGGVYELTSKGVLESLHWFSGGSDGGFPQSIAADAAGDVFGVTNDGGDTSLNNGYGWGTVFEITAAGTFETLHAFTDGADGGSPSEIELDNAGNLFGTADNGGQYQGGTVFEITAAGTFETLHAFTDGADGRSPFLIALDGGGDVFGATQFAADNTPYGAIFELADGAFNGLRSFSYGPDGYLPTSLAADTVGDVFGATEYGGDTSLNYGYGWGTIFEIAHDGAFTSLYAFAGGSDGGPPGALTTDTGGDLFGVSSTNSGGWGTVFEITAGGKFRTLHTFTGGADGGRPAAVALDAAGDVFGTANLGGYGWGTVWELTPDVRNLSRQVAVTRGGFARYPFSKTIVQKATLTNTGTALTGPVYLALDGLTNATLTNATGMTQNYSPTGSPYLLVSGSGLAAGASATVYLRFADPTLTAINYSTRVLSGAGQP